MRFFPPVLLFLLCIMPGLAVSQEYQQTNEDSSSTIEQLERILDEAFEAPSRPIGESSQSILPEGLPVSGLDDSTKAKYQESLRAYFDYRTSGYVHRQKVFTWQLVSSVVIFLVVVILVFTGLYFAWLQFRQTLVPRTDGSSTETTDAAPSITTTLEASLQGIKVSTPVLGVIILIISLLFFYLYLVYVYPIQEIL